MCAMGQYRPVAHRNPRNSAQKGASRAAVWRNPEQISPLATLGRNDKGRFPVEPGMTERKIGRNDNGLRSVKRTGLLSFRAKPQAESRNLRNDKSEIIIIFVE